LQKKLHNRNFEYNAFASFTSYLIPYKQYSIIKLPVLENNLGHPHQMMRVNGPFQTRNVINFCLKVGTERFYWKIWSRWW